MEVSRSVDQPTSSLVVVVVLAVCVVVVVGRWPLHKIHTSYIHKILDYLPARLPFLLLPFSFFLPFLPVLPTLLPTSVFPLALERGDA